MILQYFLKDFYIKPVATKIEKPSYNAPVDQVQKLIFNIIDTNNLDLKKSLNIYIYQWGDTLTFII